MLIADPEVEVVSRDERTIGEDMEGPEGIIIPANWDNNGNLVDLAIATPNEEEYLITDKNQIARLKPLLRQMVKIKGIVQTEAGRKIINVNRFSKLKNQVYSINNWSI